MPTDPLARLDEYRQRKLKNQKRRESAGDNSASIMYTGAGPDGVVQPHRPVGMLNTPDGQRMVHEDETMFLKPNGNMVVQPSDQTLMFNPTQGEQSKLMSYEKQSSVPGYQMGTGAEGVAVDPMNPMSVNPLTPLAPPAPVETPFGTGAQTNTSFTAEGTTTTPEKSANIMQFPNVDFGTGVTDQSTTPAIPTTDYDPRKYLQDIATGDNTYFNGTVDRAIGSVEDVNRQNIMLGSQQMSTNPNLTAGGENAMTTQLMSNAGATRSDAVTAAAGAQNQQMYDANKALLDENYRQDTLAEKDAQNGMYWLDQARTLQSNMLQSGMSMQDVYDNAEFQMYLGNAKNYIGGDNGEFYGDDFTTDFMITNRDVGLQETKATSEDNAIGLMQDMIENSAGTATVQDALANEDILRNASAYLGDYNPRNEDGTIKQTVIEWVTQTFGTKNRSDVQVATDYFANEFIDDDEFLSNHPNAEADLKEVIASAITNGNVVINADGTVTPTEGFSFPWDDVSGNKYTSYTTPWGEAISYDDAGNASIGGVAFDQYTMKDSNGDEIEGVTYQDFVESWEGLTISEQSIYLNNKGEVDVDEIEALVKYNPASGYWFDSDGNPIISAENVNDYRKHADKEGVFMDNFVDRSGKGLVDIGTIPDGANISDDANQLEGEGYFNYMGNDGVWNKLATNSPEFENLWYQASLEYGEPATDDMMAEWSEGKIFDKNFGTQSIYDSEGNWDYTVDPSTTASYLGVPDWTGKTNVTSSNTFDPGNIDITQFDDYVSGWNTTAVGNPSEQTTANLKPGDAISNLGSGTIYVISKADGDDMLVYNGGTQKFYLVDDSFKLQNLR